MQCLLRALTRHAVLFQYGQHRSVIPRMQLQFAAAADNRRQQQRRRFRHQQKNRAGHRLFQRFEQGVLRGRIHLVCLFNQHNTPSALECVATRNRNQRTDFIHRDGLHVRAHVRANRFAGRNDDQVRVRPVPHLLARPAHTTGTFLSLRRLTEPILRQQPRQRPLAHAFQPGNEVRVNERAVAQCAHQAIINSALSLKIAQNGRCIPCLCRHLTLPQSFIN